MQARWTGSATGDRRVRQTRLRSGAAHHRGRLPAGRWLNPVLLFALCAFGTDPSATAAPHSGKAVPNRVEFTDQAGELSLSITGVAVRRKFLVDVYSIAHYMHPPPSGELSAVLRAVLEEGSVKQVTMTFLRDLEAERIRRSMVRAFERNATDAEFREIAPHVESFTQAIEHDVEPGDEFTIRWFPGGTTAFLFEGREILRLTSRTFARIMWATWFGERAVVDRTELLRFVTDNTLGAGS